MYINNNKKCINVISTYIVRHGTAQHGTARHGTAWYNIQLTPAILNSQGTGSSRWRICLKFLIFLRTDALGHTNIYAVCLKRDTDSNKRNKEKEMTKKF